MIVDPSLLVVQASVYYGATMLGEENKTFAIVKFVVVRVMVRL